jgi:hypothetical protein
MEVTQKVLSTVLSYQFKYTLKVNMTQKTSCIFI